MLGFLLWLQLVLNQLYPVSDVGVCMDYAPPTPGMCGSPQAVALYGQVVERLQDGHGHGALRIEGLGRISGHHWRLR